MASKTEARFYVIPEGTAQEEQWTWEAIEKMCRTGRLSPKTRIFMPDRNAWAQLVDTDLCRYFEQGGSSPSSGEAGAAGADDAASALRREYDELLRRAAAEAGDLDTYVEAGRLAVGLGDREAAREHFQKALDLHPYNSRVAQEVMRRFSKSECRGFSYLQREPPAWEDPSTLVSYPFAAGLAYFAVPAAVLLVFAFLPYGTVAAAVLSYLWCLRCARDTAHGSVIPPSWQGFQENPVRHIVLPLLAGAAVAAEFLAVFYGIARLSMALGGSMERSAFRFMAASPALSVLMVVVGVGYLPAVFVRICHSVGIFVDLLCPWTIARMIGRIGQEYALTAFILLGLAFTLGGLNLLVGGVPVLGEVFGAAAAGYALPFTGFLLGRLAGRMQHVMR